MHVLMKRAIPLFATGCTGCLCFFATHFHELTALEQDKKGKGVQNLHVMAEADPESNKLTMLYKASSPYYVDIHRLVCVERETTATEDNLT